MKVGKNPIGLKKIVSKYSQKQNIFDERERIAKNEKKSDGNFTSKRKDFFVVFFCIYLSKNLKLLKSRFPSQTNSKKTKPNALLFIYLFIIIS